MDKASLEKLRNHKSGGSYLILRPEETLEFGFFVDKDYLLKVIAAIKKMNGIIAGEWGVDEAWEELLADKETEIEFKELYDLTIAKLEKIT